MAYPRTIKENNIAMLLAGENDKGITMYSIGSKKENALVKSPGGKILMTMFRSLGEKMFEDYVAYYYSSGPVSEHSIISWQNEMVDKFASTPRAKLEDMIVQEYLNKEDWTYSLEDPESKKIFGEKESSKRDIKKWLDCCKPMSLNAAYQMAKIYDSINISYILAFYMEAYNTGIYKGKRLFDKFGELADIIEKQDKFGGSHTILDDIENFYVYYGCLLNEDGNIILPKDPKQDNVLGLKVDPVVLLGRNYKHYKDGKLIEENEYKIKDISLEDCEELKVNEKLFDVIPEDCWVKRIHVDSEPYGELSFLLVLEVKDGIIKNKTIFVESCFRDDEVKYIEVPDNKSEEIVYEYYYLLAKRYLPNNFSFIGKPIPKSIIRRGETSGDAYMKSIFSDYRPAYTDLYIHPNDDDTIDYLECETYKSMGSEFANMFSRPQLISGTKEEIFDILLCLMDEYSEEEYKNL